MKKAKRPIQSEYSKLLLDPRWQKKRLEILNRDEFTCQACFDSKSTLHVHHLLYKSGRKPWEYHDSALQTLCADCHQFETDNLQDRKQTLLDSMSVLGMRAGHFDEFLSAFQHAEIRHYIDPWVSAICWAISDRDMQDHIYKEYFLMLKSKRIGDQRFAPEVFNGQS